MCTSWANDGGPSRHPPAGRDRRRLADGGAAAGRGRCGGEELHRGGGRHGQIGDSVRFRLDYARGGEDAPASLVGKFPAAGDESRKTGVALGNYIREVRFYQQLAPTALIHTPRCYSHRRR